MKRGSIIAVQITVILVVVVFGVVSYLVASGVTKAERQPQEDHPDLYGLHFYDVTFPSRRGDVVLEGWYIRSQDSAPTLIFVHGLGSERSGDGAVELAAKMVDLGYEVLMFDLRGHGTSGGDKVSGGDMEQEDVLGAFDYLVDRGVAAEKIGLLGFSMGAGVGLMAASREPRIRAVVADSTFARAGELIAQETARKTAIPKWLTPIFMPTSRLMATLLYEIDIDENPPEEAVTYLPYPILVIHGMEDTRVRDDHGRRVHGAAHAESVLWLVPDVGHADTFLTFPEEYVSKVNEYFKARLKLD